MARQLLHLCGLVAQPSSNTFGRPAESLASFNGPQPMNDFSENVGGSEAVDIFIFDSREKLLASGPILKVCGEVIEKCVGIQEHRLAGGNIVEGHGPSSGSFSTS